MSYFFQNDTKDIVTESLAGLLSSSHSPVARLDVGNPDINVVVRADWSATMADTYVAVVSGGGSGHEPMHGGFVGAGMLTAAVCGGLFASPSYDAVLSTILHVAGKAGVLLVVKAYTGDCLIFGLAAEKARSLGVRVEMIIFSDDISIPHHPRPRGLAGTILVHKVCGFAAQMGRTLEEVKADAERVMRAVSTIGVSITSCRTPTSTNENRVRPGCAELGLGIHGEPGVEVITTQNVDMIVKRMVQMLAEKRKGEIAILLNNLGGVSELEMGIVCASLLKILKQNENSLTPKLLIGPAQLCTSLDMKGFSISFLELHQGFEEALKAPVNAQGWVQPVEIHDPLVVKARNQDAIARKVYKPSKDAKVESIVKTVCEVLISNEENLNNLDSFVGDGDTGLTFASGSRAVLAALKENKLPCGNLGDLFENIAEILDISMGGSSGILLSILFMNSSIGIKEGKTLQEALLGGVNKMMELGGAKPGFRTMIDSLLPAVEALKDGIEAAALAAEKGVENTKTMEKAGAGRSTYLNSESLKGHADSGASAIAISFRSIANLLK